MEGHGRKGGRLDLAGRRFGMLTALEDVGRNRFGYRLWRCRCDCGGERVATTQALTSGVVKACKNHRGNRVDMTGRRFGMLTVTGPAPRREGAKYHEWVCRCDCGGEKIARGDLLRSGKVKSCGCKHRAMDLTGQRYGHLVVLERAEPSGRNSRWLCRCDCGREKVILGLSLRSGNTKSCGCMGRGRRKDEGDA